MYSAFSFDDAKIKTTYYGHVLVLDLCESLPNVDKIPKFCSLFYDYVIYIYTDDTYRHEVTSQKAYCLHVSHKSGFQSCILSMSLTCT